VSGASAGFEARVDRLTCSLLARIARGMNDAREIEGASETFAFLQRRRIRVAIGSGLPHALAESLAVRLGWLEKRLVDFVTSAEAAGAGRPDPAMIRSAMAHAGVADPRTVLKVGDTVVDIEEGRNAGAWTAAVLTGSQPRSLLESAGPDFILASVAAVADLFGDLGRTGSGR
jgi:HAD superfamily hydrolase (TIGR01549 family)